MIWFLTVVIIIFAVVIPVFYKDLSIIANLGSYFSGVTSALAFIWLIAGFLQQSKELKLQREELTLQRRSLELQKDE